MQVAEKETQKLLERKRQQEEEERQEQELQRHLEAERRQIEEERRRAQEKKVNTLFNINFVQYGHYYLVKDERQLYILLLTVSI